MSFKAWRVKVSICQSDPTVLSVPPSPPQGTESPPAPVKDGTSPPPGRNPSIICSQLKQRLMDVGVSPSASQNPKVSKPSLGVRVLRTLFDNSPPTYTSAKSQVAAQAKERQRLQELQEAQELRRAQQQAPQVQPAQKNVSSRPPTPKNLSGEVVRRHSNTTHTDKLTERSGRYQPGPKKGGHGRVSHFSSKSSLTSNDNRSSFDSLDDAQSSVSTDSEYDSSSFYRNNSHQEVHNMHRPALRDLRGDYDLGSGHVYDSVVPEADQDLESAEKLEYLKQEIERLRLENVALRQRGSVDNHHHLFDSDLSRASSMTEVSNIEEAADDWIPYAEYAPAGVTAASVARFHGQQLQYGGYRRGEMSRQHPPGERYFPGEHATRVVIGGGGGNGSSSETVSMVTDGSRASSRHDSGLLVEQEPESGLTSRHNSGLRSDHEDHVSVMSWDESRHHSGPMVDDRHELYGLTNNSYNSRATSRNNSGMLVDCDDQRGESVTPLAGNSRENSRHNSGMQVDREGRDLPPTLVSPRISFEAGPMPAAMPLSNSKMKTVEETVTTHRFVTRERHLVEPESRNNNASSTQKGKKYEEYESSNQANLSWSNNYKSHPVEAPSRTSTPPPTPTHLRNFEDYEVPSRTTTPTWIFDDFNDTEGTLAAQSTSASPQPPRRRGPTPPRSKNSSHELDPANSSMFSYPTPSIITVPRSRSTHNQLDGDDLQQFLQQQHGSSRDNAHINSIPRSRSTHSQVSKEDSGTASTTAISQHQSTLERLMISQQRRQNMSSNPVSVNTSPDRQYSSQLQNKSPHRRS